MDKTKASISGLRNDDGFERLIERTKALERSIEETDTETDFSKRQRSVIYLAANCEEEFTIFDSRVEKALFCYHRPSAFKNGLSFRTK